MQYCALIPYTYAQYAKHHTSTFITIYLHNIYKQESLARKSVSLQVQNSLSPVCSITPWHLGQVCPSRTLILSLPHCKQSLPTSLLYFILMLKADAASFSSSFQINTKKVQYLLSSCFQSQAPAHACDTNSILYQHIYIGITPFLYITTPNRPAGHQSRIVSSVRYQGSRICHPLQ